MVFVRGMLTEDNKMKLDFFHFAPDELSENDMVGGYLIENSKLTAPMITGKTITYFYDIDTGNISYDYKDAPVQEKSIDQVLTELSVENISLKSKVDLLSQALDDLILNGGMI